MIKIGVIGTGYVGLITGVCLSDCGWQVTCVDKNEKIIHTLNDGIAPIYEPGLDELISKNIYYKRVDFTTDIERVINDSEVIFIAVGTPHDNMGRADLTDVYEVAHEIGRNLNGYKIIVNKSTVPVGTGREVKKIILNELFQRGLNIEFEIVSNPEFLRQGSAIQDFTKAGRVVIGSESPRAINTIEEIYSSLYKNEPPFLIVNIETAELIKYASNAFLATKISFINELSELCEKIGANIEQVAKGMGMDNRIGPEFLHAGPGYGGSCFPKDTKALVRIGESFNIDLGIVKATISANEKQKLRMVEKIKSEMGILEGKKFGILGLSFKNNTDDMREAPSIKIIEELSLLGAEFKVFDPKAIEKARQYLIDIPIIEYCEDEYDVCEGVDAVILITEWTQFRSLNIDKIKSNMSGNYFFDLRNIYNKESMIKKGFEYFSVGRV